MVSPEEATGAALISSEERIVKSVGKADLSGRARKPAISESIVRLA